MRNKKNNIALFFMPFHPDESSVEGGNQQCFAWEK